MERRQTRKVIVGNMAIGGDAPISIQSMTNTDTHDIEATYRQVMSLCEAGCDIVRITAPDIESVKTFTELRRRGITIPLVADIHFNYKIAIACAEAGVDKIRINPGNIGDDEKVRLVTEACRASRVPIRIGVNSGSLESSILKKHGGPTAAALAESALYHVSLLERFDFRDIIISVKASTPMEMIEANRILAEKTDYPLHLGVTEAGGGESAVIKSSAAIGALLSSGIGDTIRVSLTDTPDREVEVARQILSVFGLSREKRMDIVSCPTCGRTRIDLIAIHREFEKRIKSEGLDRLPVKVALMGCAVNGPGEAREADIGIAGGDGEGLLFKKGEIIRKVSEDRLVDTLIEELKNMI